jgi:chromosome segregation ATPase
MQAIKLETSNFEMENEKLSKQVAALLEDNNTLKSRISHLENLRRSSGGRDIKSDLNYSEENFEFLRDEHAKVQHSI